MVNILITDGLWRKSLVATRALGQKGIGVSVVGDSFFTSSFFSKYCKKRIILPLAKNDPENFRLGIIKELKEKKYDLLIPMEDETIAVLLKVRKTIEKLTNFPVPSKNILEKAWDKAETIKIAKKIGIPVPKTYFSPDDKNIEFPLVVKPRKGSGGRGLVYIDNRDDLQEEYRWIQKEYSKPLIQERLPQEGEELGVNLLFNENQKVMAGFTYKRLRSYPVSGGPSTLRESTKNDHIMEMAIALMKAMKWYGVAMIEFKKDSRNGKMKLMEVNPRFWGSLALSISAGVNFPYLLYKMAMGEKLKPVFDYKIGVRCRWLVPGDILHFLSNPKRFSMKQSFFDFFDKNTKYDQLSFEDFSGTLGVIASTLFHSVRPDMWKLVFRKNKKTHINKLETKQRLYFFLATGLVGDLLPFPGALGTFIGALIYFLILKHLSPASLLLSIILLIIISIFVSKKTAEIFQEKDPPQIIIDEAIGFLSIMPFFDFSWHELVIAFILFRIIDNLKPYPIKLIEKKSPVILKIIIDDLVAAGYTIILLNFIKVLMIV